jgi:hypothetical protein
MMFSTKCLPEPDLEFGEGGRHIDPRYGLMTHGPLQAKPGDLIRIGVIGTSETVDGIGAFMERAMAAEVLALTKMNWNSTQFDGALPIPIRAARQVGRVLKHLSM